MSVIQPALMEQDWRDARECGPMQMFVMSTDGIPPHLLPQQNGHRPGAMLALANDLLPDQHPLKITRADVKMLERIPMIYDSEGITESRHSVRDHIRALAAKLAALLPPEHLCAFPTQLP